MKRIKSISVHIGFWAWLWLVGASVLLATLTGFNTDDIPMLVLWAGLVLMVVLDNITIKFEYYD